MTLSSSDITVVALATDSNLYCGSSSLNIHKITTPNIQLSCVSIVSSCHEHCPSIAMSSSPILHKSPSERENSRSPSIERLLGEVELYILLEPPIEMPWTRKQWSTILIIAASAYHFVGASGSEQLTFRLPLSKEFIQQQSTIYMYNQDPAVLNANWTYNGLQLKPLK